VVVGRGRICADALVKQSCSEHASYGARVAAGAYIERRIVHTSCTDQAWHMTIPQGSPAGSATGSPIRVMTVDDHPIFRGGLAALIAAYADLQLVAEATNGREAAERYRQHLPDVTLMDLSMPIMGGVEAISTIRAEFPEARVIALTTWDGDADIHRALDAGARGYLLKDVVSEDVARAVRHVHSGGKIIPADVAGRLAAFTPRIDLTERELEVLGYMAKGLSNKQIGALLGRSEGTIKVHVIHILQKLDVSDRTEAVTLALQRGIIHLP
jgi:DNA-binding NarL/FixJ family response regulator